MKNNNALISMAMVSQNANNPFYIFCEYIKYCIFSSANDELIINKLKKLIEDEFDIIIPNHVIIYCLQILENEGYVSLNNYMIKKVGDYNCSIFDQKRNEYRKKEKEVVDSLIQFAKEYERNWDYEKTWNMLIKVLDERRLAYDIFIDPSTANNTFETIDDELENDLIETDSEESTSTAPIFRDELLVGKFIQKNLNTKSLERDYLVSICSGLMLCIGAYQIPSDNNVSSLTNIKNTHFIFDTRLLLRYATQSIK